MSCVCRRENYSFINSISFSLSSKTVSMCVCVCVCDSEQLQCKVNQLVNFMIVEKVTLLKSPISRQHQSYLMATQSSSLYVYSNDSYCKIRWMTFQICLLHVMLHLIYFYVSLVVLLTYLFREFIIFWFFFVMTWTTCIIRTLLSITSNICVFSLELVLYQGNNNECLVLLTMMLHVMLRTCAE